MIIAATGHRPQHLGGHSLMIRRALGALATEYLDEWRPEKVISGMAIGWDQAVAAAAIVMGIPVLAAVPFEGYETRWPFDMQERFRRLLARCTEVHFVEQPLVDGITMYPMQRRNEWMVDRADRMVALWSGAPSGTWNCVKYALERHVPVDNLWLRWRLPEDVRSLVG